MEKHSDISFTSESTDKNLTHCPLILNTITKKKNLGVTLSGTIFDQEGPDLIDFIRSAEYTEYNWQLRNDMLYGCLWILPLCSIIMGN